MNIWNPELKEGDEAWTLIDDYESDEMQCIRGRLAIILDCKSIKKEHVEYYNGGNYFPSKDICARNGIAKLSTYLETGIARKILNLVKEY